MVHGIDSIVGLKAPPVEPVELLKDLLGMALVEPQVVRIGFSDLATRRGLVQPHDDRRRAGQLTELGNQPRLLLAQISQACLLLGDALAKGGR